MWDIKYRPLRFSDVLGQQGAVKVLKGRLVRGTALDTSYIFSGGHGQGKTSLARILARAILCQNLGEDGEPCNECENCEAILGETSMAFVELDAASQGTIDNIRDIVNDLPFVVPGAPKRIYLFDEAHRMGSGAQDVLLKPIEDKAMVAILCTTEPEKIRGPIRSRCEEHAIRRITREDILKRMQAALEVEGVEFEDDAILTVIDYCNGHVRDVFNKLEMVAQLGPVSVEAVRANLNLSVVSTYYDILLSLGDPTRAVELVEQACDRVGPDEVATGLAEAAMNAYRLAKGMFVEFVLMDRQKATQVYETYGEGATALAQYFLTARRVTKVGLVCSIVQCAGGVPAPAARETRVMVSVAPPKLDASVAAPASPPKALSEDEPAHTPEPEPEPQKAPEKPGNGQGLRADGIGDLGSGDIGALTVCDSKGVPETQPRKRHGAEQGPKLFTGSEGPQKLEEIQTADQFRREFKLTCQGGERVK